LIALKFKPINQEHGMSEIIEKTFNVASPARLHVNNIRGSVEILSSEDGIIHVTATKQTHTGDVKNTSIEITQEDDGTIKTATHFPEAGWSWLFGSQPCEVDYTFKAPRLCSIQVNGVSNTVLIKGIEGDVSVNSVSGEISLQDLTGAVRTHTVSGETNGERISGSLCLDTVSGEGVVKDSHLTSIKGNSVSGEMQIWTSLAEGPYHFKSVSGDVRLSVPPTTHCSVELHSVSGNLVSAFPVSGFSSQHRSQTVNIQGGGVKISLHSVSGDLSLDCDGEMPPAPESASSTTSVARLVLLERVERGEMSVDEALVQLLS
jgi:hypothetical protein